MPGAAIERKHHHYCQHMILETENFDVGLCYVCGHYLFVSSNKDGTTYRVATQREEELITYVMYVRQVRK